MLQAEGPAFIPWVRVREPVVPLIHGYVSLYDFPSSHIWMWELNHKEGWALKNQCFWNVELEKTLESPLDSKKIKPVNLKGNQPWIFTGRTDAEAEVPILWPPNLKSRLTGKDPDAGKDWRQEKKGTIEDEMLGWHHWLNGHEFAQTPGESKGQVSLACCSPWGHKESDMTEQLNDDDVSLWSLTFWRQSRRILWDFPGGSAAKTLCSQCRAVWLGK